MFRVQIDILSAMNNRNNVGTLSLRKFIANSDPKLLALVKAEQTLLHLFFIKTEKEKVSIPHMSLEIMEEKKDTLEHVRLKKACHIVKAAHWKIYVMIFLIDRHCYVT